MAVKSSGTLSFTNIKDEFGLPPNKNFGAYRVSQSVGDLSGLALDNDDNFNALIPQSGQISFGQFYGKRLNVVVDYHSGGDEFRPSTGKSKYDGKKVTVIGGFKTRPSSTAGIKVYLHVNKDLGSKKGAKTLCALRTGTFSSSATVYVDVGDSGAIYGAGGNGGSGYTCDGGSNGVNGTSALGVQTSGVKIRVKNGGRIQAGYGGGGGAGGGHNDPDKNTQDHASGGGGGGGGAGFPTGDGGKGGKNSFGKGDDGGNGSSGSKTGGGNGGGGGDGGGSEGGTGGDGGAPGDNAGNGGGGSGNVCKGGGRSGGSNGSAIRKAGSGSFSIISGSNRVFGDTSGSGVA